MPCVGACSGVGGVNFPPEASRNGYKYYFGEESLVRKGIFGGWRRFEKEFPAGIGWEEMRGHLHAYADLEVAVTAWFQIHGGRNSVEIFK